MAEHKGNTNKINKIKLEPSIDRVVWTSGSGSAGSKAGLEVNTHFVGNGSELKIELKDASGKSVGSASGKITGSKYWAEIDIPEKAKDSLTAKVKLSKHGLEMDSNPLRVYPPIEMKNLKWDKKEAGRGDVLTITADVNGVWEGSEAEVQIWEYDTDLAHDLITKFPVIIKKNKIEVQWAFEYHEDTDEIPTAKESEKGYNPPEYFFRVVIGGKQEDSEMLKFKDWIVISLADAYGNPASDADYEIELADGSKKNGKLDSEGTAKVEDIPPGPIKVTFPKNK